MPTASRTLPANYHKVAEINLAEQTKLMLALNVAVLAVLAVVGALTTVLLHRSRPGLFATAFEMMTVPGRTAAILTAIAIMIFVHEGIHGFFFWLFTSAPPKFGLGLTYVYAAAPEWYLPPKAYLVVGLAPLALIGLAALPVMALASPPVALAAALTFVFNTAGAMGDVFIVSRVLRRSPACLVNDRGHSVALYEPDGATNG